MCVLNYVRRMGRELTMMVTLSIGDVNKALEREGMREFYVKFERKPGIKLNFRVNLYIITPMNIWKSGERKI